MYDLILKNFHFKDENVLCAYSYGSRVYQTHSDKSDHDFIIVLKEFDKSLGNGITLCRACHKKAHNNWGSHVRP